MKKILMVMAVCLMSAISFGQKYDNLKCPVKIISNQLKITKSLSSLDDKAIALLDSFGNYNVKVQENKPRYIGTYRIQHTYGDITDIDCTITFWNDLDNMPVTEELSEFKLNDYKISADSKSITFYDNSYYTNYCIPETIYKNYKIGDNCVKSGAVFMPIGILLSIVGGCIYSQSPTTASALLGVGGSFVGISLPLIYFGDHIKRETNMVYNVLK